MNKKIANIRHNSLASPQLAAKHTDPSTLDDASSSLSYRPSSYLTNSPLDQSYVQDNANDATSFGAHSQAHTRDHSVNVSSRLGKRKHTHSSHAEKTSSSNAGTKEPVGLYPTRIQEYAMIEDLLYVLMVSPCDGYI